MELNHNEGNWLTQYKLSLFEFTLWVAAISSALIGVLHYFNIYQYNSIPHSYNCFIFSAYQAVILVIYLRNKNNLFFLVWLSMLPVLLILTSNLVYSTSENVRLLWFVVAYIPAQFLGGVRLGLTVHLSSIVIIVGYYLSTDTYHEIDILSSITILSICYLFIFYLQKLLEKADIKISSYQTKLKDMIVRDSLTGIFNRHHFDERLKHEWMRSIRDKSPIALLMADIDYFKEYNDLYGHIEGDKCLKNIAVSINKSLVRVTDLMFRYGGEEFAIILPNTNLESAHIVAEKIRMLIKSLAIEHKKSGRNGVVTISIGVFSMNPAPKEKQEILLVGADKNLYIAKENGRNQVV